MTPNRKSWSYALSYVGFCGLVLTAILCASGCGHSSGNVSGKVYFGKKPLVYGSVLLVTKDRMLRQGDIKPDGSYVISEVPSGEVRIAVISVDPQKFPEMRDTLPALDTKIKFTYDFDPSHWFKIPERYGDPKESGLSIIVSPGSNRHDIHLHQ